MKVLLLCLFFGLIASVVSFVKPDQKNFNKVSSKWIRDTGYNPRYNHTKRDTGDEDDDGNNDGEIPKKEGYLIERETGEETDEGKGPFEKRETGYNPRYNHTRRDTEDDDDGISYIQE